MGKDEAGTHQALGALRHAVDPLISAHGGRIVGTAGDSLLADFSSVVDALSCAVEMQRASRAINEPVAPERRLELRIGVNLGDVIVDGDDIGDFADGVIRHEADRAKCDRLVTFDQGFARLLGPDKAALLGTRPAS